MSIEKSPLFPAISKESGGRTLDQRFCNDRYIVGTLKKLAIKWGTVHKVRLLLGGGGIKCCGIPAALGALVDEYGLLYPKEIMAGSGSAGSAPYFIAGQFDKMLKVWAHEISCQSFINKGRDRIINTITGWMGDLIGLPNNPHKPRMVDIEHLVKVIMKENRALDFEALMNSPTQLIIRATDQSTGKVRSISNHPGTDHQLENIEQLNQTLIGSKAIMVASGQRGNLGKPGLDKLIDTESSAHGAGMVLDSIDDEIKKAILFTTFNFEDKDHWMYKTLLMAQSREFRRNYNKKMEAMKRLREQYKKEFTEGGIISIEKTDICIVPVNNEANMFDNEPNSLKDGIESGYRAAKYSDPLREFFQDIETFSILPKIDEFEIYNENTPTPFKLENIKEGTRHRKEKMLNIKC